MGLTIGSLHVRRSILCKAGPVSVWQEFETFDRIGAWFGRGHELHRFEAKLGGQVDKGALSSRERDIAHAIMRTMMRDAAVRVREALSKSLACNDIKSRW
jgi:hypothetical protein